MHAWKSVCCSAAVRATALATIGLVLCHSRQAWAGPPPSLSLEIAETCPGDANGGGPGDLFTVELYMRDVTTPVSGFQAFVAYDDALLDFRADLSTYTLAPFPLHALPMAGVESVSGELNLDGAITFGGSSVTGDAKLADLVFQVQPGADCMQTDVVFRLNPPFLSELSLDGSPLATALSNAPTITLDHSPPVLTTGAIAACYPTAADAELAALAATTAVDNCTTTGDLTFSAAAGGDPCAAEITVGAADACGNSAEFDYATRIDSTPPMLISGPTDMVVQAAPGSCEAIVTFDDPVFEDNCDASPPSAACTPPSGSVFPAGTTQVICTAEDECGNLAIHAFDVTVEAVRNRLEWEIVDPQSCYAAGDVVCVTLTMKCLDQPVTGFNAFLEYEADLLDFLPGASSYTMSPFPVHISNPLTAVVAGDAGKVDLDGAVFFGGAGTQADAVLATLCFEVRPAGGGQILAFEFRPPPSPTIGNELSFEGVPVPTALANDVSPAPTPTLSLVSTTQRECYEAHDIICVELRMRCMGHQFVTGFNAFVDFDIDVLKFEPSLSAYTFSPFPIHISPLLADGGRIRVDGSSLPLSPGTNLDALLATLCFRVKKFSPGQTTVVAFGPPPTPTIGNEFSLLGNPVPAALEDASILTQSTLGLRLCPDEGGLICLYLEATCLDQPITGYRAFIEYNNDVLEFQPVGGYEPAPFTVHVNDPITPVIMGSSGWIDLDGALPPMTPGVMDDSILASVCFEPRAGFEDVASAIVFRPPPAPGVDSEFLVEGVPIATYLRDSILFARVGDLNLDGLLDLVDVAIMADVLVGIDTDQGRRQRADVNCDGITNGLDIQPFVDLFLP